MIYFSLYLVEVGGVADGMEIKQPGTLCVSGEDPGPERRETARQESVEAFECEYFEHFKGRHPLCISRLEGNCPVPLIQLNIFSLENSPDSLLCHYQCSASD